EFAETVACVNDMRVRIDKSGRNGLAAGIDPLGGSNLRFDLIEPADRGNHAVCDRYGTIFDNACVEQVGAVFCTAVGRAASHELADIVDEEFAGGHIRALSSGPFCGFPTS